jgi:alpha-L-arabinofuranosidase
LIFIKNDVFIKPMKTEPSSWKLLAFCALGAVAALPCLAADPPSPAAVLTIDAASPGTRVSPRLFGAFFEDINYGADGGLYAELVQNRSFESRLDAESWRAAGDAAKTSIAVLQDQGLSPANPRYASVRVTAAGQGIENGGYGGMKFVQGESYSVSAYIRSDDPVPPRVSFVLEDAAGGGAVASFEAGGIGPRWKRFGAALVAAKGSSSGRLEVLASGPGSFQIDLVSVFPASTFKGRPNGLRADLAAMIGDLKPGFLRFPGGCVVEGRTIATAYRWKDTIGDIAQRKDNENLWGYRQSYGLGFFEYLQFCEDIGAEPLPVINCGMACQARGDETVPLSDLGPWIQDALDLIEYAKGSPDTAWGAVRAKSGHPRPFDLKTLAVGNEQWGSGYYSRYAEFAKAIKAKHPEMRLVFAAGPAAGGAQFDDAWRQARLLGVDLVDEHFYMTPEWFLANTDRYDSYDRKGPKVFLGEYAAQAPSKANSLYSALAEAAFMTGLERNGDIVELASYAPLLARSGHTQWIPDLIWFDGQGAYGSPNYYVQKLFSANRSAASLPFSLDISPAISKAQPPGGGIGLGTWGTRAEFKDVKVSDREGRTLFAPSLDSLEGWQAGMGMWKAEGGTLSQKSSFPDCRLVHNAPEWSGYSLELKARKLSGAEGILVMFGVRGQDYYWWNLGGWGNSASAVERGTGSSRSPIGGSLPMSIETGRWYDLRVELDAEKIRCFLDGELVHEVKAPKAAGPIFAHAGTDAEGNYILKLVNMDAEARDLRVELQGSRPLEGSCVATVLSSPDPGAVNSLAAPEAVYPKTLRLEGLKADFLYTLEPNSLTVLRIPVK